MDHPTEEELEDYRCDILPNIRGGNSEDAWCEQWWQAHDDRETAQDGWDEWVEMMEDEGR